jgi:hypothetical protein
MTKRRRTLIGTIGDLTQTFAAMTWRSRNRQLGASEDEQEKRPCYFSRRRAPPRRRSGFTIVRPPLPCGTTCFIV